MDSIETDPSPRLRAAVAVCSDKGLLLVRHQKGERSYWLLPGGGVDWGEAAPAAAAREVLEETGLTVRIGRLMLVGETLAPDRSRHVLHLVFEGHLEGGILEVGDDPRVAEARFVALDQVSGLVLHPPIWGQLERALQGSLGTDELFAGGLWID